MIQFTLKKLSDKQFNELTFEDFLESLGDTYQQKIDTQMVPHLDDYKFWQQPRITRTKSDPSLPTQASSNNENLNITR